MSGATVLPALHVEVLEGAGPPVLFLPGLGATTRYWARRVNPLLDRATLVLVDLLGFGRSPKPRVRYSVDRHLAALEPVLRSRETPVIAVNAVRLDRAGEIRNGFQAIIRAMEICHRQHAHLRFAQTDLTLRPRFRRDIDTLEFSARRKCAAAGIRIPRQERRALRTLLGA